MLTSFFLSNRFHFKCVNLTKKVAEQLSEYICPPCQEKTGKKSKSEYLNLLENLFLLRMEFVCLFHDDDDENSCSTIQWSIAIAAITLPLLLKR